jgi:hypothetical protein
MHLTRDQGALRLLHQVVSHKYCNWASTSPLIKDIGEIVLGCPVCGKKLDVDFKLKKKECHNCGYTAHL